MIRILGFSGAVRRVWFFEERGIVSEPVRLGNVVEGEFAPSAFVASWPVFWHSLGRTSLSPEQVPECSMTERRPNRLAQETSPYLLQHANNPVDWYPWGEAAFEVARREDKPIFLSVGYSSCHWCHVMEHESFENPAIATVMNELFVNVKVDREERPDIDSMYMNAVQLLTGQGGWPMSVFLTPDLRPFWGGTYFPPDRRYGRPGFPDVLLHLAKLYEEQPGKIEEAASSLVERLSAKDDLGGEGMPGVEDLRAAAEDAARRFDPKDGGFGSAPKFPRSVEISMLLRARRHEESERILPMCEKTLEAMAHGGIYDQIGGGFHRYSVDAKWLVPHFEKMLYDNALLVKTYLEAYQLTKDPLYERIARETLDYVLREMTSDEGGFFSATDADSDDAEGQSSEGVFFVWTPSQVAEVIGDEDAKLVCSYYGITEAGNFEHATSIAHVTRPLSEVAEECGVGLSAAEATLANARQKLYDAREGRPRPFRDEKVLTAWNGLMISAFARGRQVLGDEKYEIAARRAADLVLSELSGENGRLLRVRKDGESRIDAFLDDYAYFVEALVDLWETSFDPRYLREARRLTDLVLDGFRDKEDGGFFFTSEAHETVIARRKDATDTATPSPCGILALILLRLERLTGHAPFRETAEEALRSIRGAIGNVPMVFGSSLLAIDFLLEPPVEVAVIGRSDDAVRRELIDAVHAGFLPSRVLAAAAPEEVEGLSGDIPLLAGKASEDGSSRAFVCRNFACQAPVATAVELARDLPFADSRKG